MGLIIEIYKYFVRFDFKNVLRDMSVVVALLESTFLFFVLFCCFNARHFSPGDMI